jgi:hypothetical protein
MDDYFGNVAVIASDSLAQPLVIGGEGNNTGQAQPKPEEEQSFVMFVAGVGALVLIAVWAHERLGKKKRWRK